MSEAFDPYYEWLGIPPKDQPPNHYRLLGIELWESNPRVIEHAADQRMAYLRTFQTGPHGALSQKLLNEVAAAKVCLLKPEKKAAYDTQLRQELLAAAAQAELSPSPITPTLPPSVVPPSIPQAAPIPASLAPPNLSPSVVPDIPAGGISVPGTRRPLARAKMPAWFWVLAVAVPVLMVAVLVLVVMDFEDRPPPVRQTAQATHAKSAQTSNPAPNQTTQKESTKPPEPPKPPLPPSPKEKPDEHRVNESPVEVVQPPVQPAPPEKAPEKPVIPAPSQEPSEAIRQWIDGWSEPENLGPPINTPHNDYFPELSADGLVLLFVSNRPGGHGGTDIWMSQRASLREPFGPPVNLGPPINTSAAETCPALSPDGLMLLFVSSRPGGEGIWMSRRSSVKQPFGQPIHLGPPINPGSTPSFSSDGLILLFESSRPGGVGIWMSRRASRKEPFGPPVYLGPPIHTNTPTGAPRLSADGLILLFHSDRPGGQGGGDIWISRRASPKEPFEPPINLGPSINTRYFEGGPKLSANGSILLFHSDRPGGQGGLDIWMSRRRTDQKLKLKPNPK